MQAYGRPNAFSHQNESALGAPNEFPDQMVMRSGVPNAFRGDVTMRLCNQMKLRTELGNVHGAPNAFPDQNGVLTFAAPNYPLGFNVGFTLVAFPGPFILGE